MSHTPSVLAFAGSLRTGSFNKKLVHAAAVAAREAGAKVTEVDLRDLPMPIFDEDLEREQGMPANAKALRELLLSHDGLLIASPEYNSSVTAVLKNVIDWTSRPVPGGKPLDCFVGKVAGLMAASPGALGGLRGLVTLRMILGNIGVIVLPDQIAIPQAHEAFDEAGRLKDPKKQATVDSIAQRVARMASQLNR